mgnify:CR=1 FL=1
MCNIVYLARRLPCAGGNTYLCVQTSLASLCNTHFKYPVLACDNDVLSCDDDVLVCDNDVLACDDDVLVCDDDVLACDDDVLVCDGDVLACHVQAVRLILCLQPCSCVTYLWGADCASTTGESPGSAAAYRGLTDVSETAVDELPWAPRGNS